MELGCGRGGLTRFIASELKKKDKLGIMIGNNISGRENEYNVAEARKAGLTEEEFRIDLGSFDDLSMYHSDIFDMIIVNDSMVYSNDYDTLLREVVRMLKPGGHFIFTDLLKSEEATAEQLVDVYLRLGLRTMATEQMIERILISEGMTCLFKDVKAEGIIKHYGYMKYCAGETKRQELKDAGVDDAFVEKQLKGLSKWIECAEQGLVLWGWFIFRKQQDARS